MLFELLSRGCHEILLSMTYRVVTVDSDYPDQMFVEASSTTQRIDNLNAARHRKHWLSEPLRTPITYIYSHHCHRRCVKRIVGLPEAQSFRTEPLRESLFTHEFEGCTLYVWQKACCAKRRSDILIRGRFRLDYPCVFWSMKSTAALWDFPNDLVDEFDQCVIEIEEAREQFSGAYDLLLPEGQA